jgi:RNA polymerase sporulation-specific sigma factor
MHLRSLKKTRKDVSLHDPIGTDKEGNEITLIDILGSEADDVVEKVQLKIEKSKIYQNLEILDDRAGSRRRGEDAARDCEGARDLSRIEKRALMNCIMSFIRQSDEMNCRNRPASVRK